jgi:sec-independent protein translocase protein TatA
MIILPLNFLGGSMSGGEILLILTAMLLLFGSKKLPGMARNLGKSIEAFRKASREVTDEIMRADLEDKPEKKEEPPAAPKELPAPEIKPADKAVHRDHESSNA